MAKFLIEPLPPRERWPRKDYARKASNEFGTMARPTAKSRQGRQRRRWSFEEAAKSNVSCACTDRQRVPGGHGGYTDVCYSAPAGASRRELKSKARPLPVRLVGLPAAATIHRAGAGIKPEQMILSTDACWRAQKLFDGQGRLSTSSAGPTTPSSWATKVIDSTFMIGTMIMAIPIRRTCASSSVRTQAGYLRPGCTLYKKEFRPLPPDGYPAWGPERVGAALYREVYEVLMDHAHGTSGREDGNQYERRRCR